MILSSPTPRDSGFRAGPRPCRLFRAISILLCPHNAEWIIQGGATSGLSRGQRVCCEVAHSSVGASASHPFTAERGEKAAFQRIDWWWKTSVKRRQQAMQDDGRNLSVAREHL